MFVLGIQGSPRKKGNTAELLNAFMEEAKKLGAKTFTIDVCEKNISPCIECKICEKTGECSLKDDMMSEIYPLFRKADLVVTATPIFFYNVPAQLKALIDRSQTLWSRKYMLKLDDPGRKFRKGYLLAIGATKGKNLFEGVSLTAKYFYDAIGADFTGSLTYRQVEETGDILKHETAIDDAKERARELINPLLQRKKIIFVCRENACRSQMASAFAQFYGGERLEVMSGGSDPAETPNEFMVQAMSEKGIDMGFRIPMSIEEAIGKNEPDISVSMGCEVVCPVFSGAETIEWDLPDPSGKSIEFMRELRDEIEKKTLELLKIV